ncbi:DUF3238 domain-containing protein [Bacillus mojavensis]|uniref:DUF3238 domain-containing protein n=1 Tax=Bacillus mojavensis TaxID=72360 RepID=UPI00227F2F39|nr:DUF3238 domain-containing protein [Bacillus mojavensis]MCY9089336.1 DUF3238 domain-containing protein [Bacillus mojavensis]MEC1634997.1 DUF3238 domain-containing protein [Bacillus mojavensis]MEC1801230.1 DUF3238 domain-containing protein [Bacillus mojavensis]
MYLKKVIAFLVPLYFLLGLSAVHAEERDGVKEIDHQATSDTVKLTWSGDSENYEIFKDGKSIYKGSAKQFVDKKLKSGTQYHYMIVARDKSFKHSVADAKVLTKNPSTFSSLSISSKNDNKLNPISLNAISYNDRVELNWDSSLPDDDHIIEVYRDGKLLSEFKDNHSYIDSDVESNKTYSYNLVGKQKLSDEKIKVIKETYKKMGEPITKEMEEDLFYNKFQLGRSATTLSNNMGQKSVKEFSALAATKKYAFKYMTFIPDKTAKPPVPVNFKFKGDAREFDFTSNKYRTRTILTTTFGSGTSYSLSKSVGQTHKLKNDGTVEKATASSKGITAKMIEKNNKDYISVKVNHHVGIPFKIYGMDPPAIDYDYVASVHKNGSFQITGNHDGAPSHEMYAYIPNAAAEALIIIQDKNKGFKYLAPGTARTKIYFHWIN